MAYASILYAVYMVGKSTQIGANVKNSVILKSFSSGISVIMDENISYEELLENIAVKFKEADSFFKNASVAISLEGRVLNEQEEREILDVITQNSRLNVLCLMGRDEEKNIKFLGIQNNLTFQKDENCGQFYRGTLSDGQSIETEHSIVILGDVGEGCSVYSAKDIVILGKLLGDVYAGAGGNSNHFVVALEMAPIQIRIGDTIARSNNSTGKPEKIGQGTMIAFVDDNNIYIEKLDKGTLDDIRL